MKRITFKYEIEMEDEDSDEVCYQVLAEIISQDGNLLNDDSVTIEHIEE